jgi:hypothetical protein
VKGAPANREAAERFAANVLPVIEKLRASGVTSLLGLAQALNERGVRLLVVVNGTPRASRICWPGRCKGFPPARRRVGGC